MPEIGYKTKGGSAPSGKPKIYFTCHAADFGKYFDTIANDILFVCDCAIYYTKDMRAPFSQEEQETDLGSVNLFAVPVTWNLLNEPSRAMDEDIRFAKEQHIPILPFMMEEGLDRLYAKPEAFGTRQYLKPSVFDITEIGYKSKLERFLKDTFINPEEAKKIEKEFDTYVFLSYRKKDRKYANDLMRIIHNIPGFRAVAVWYDEFLTPSESFEKNISELLHKSSIFLLLVTPNLLEFRDGKPNFVMEREYPMAREMEKNGKIRILPIEAQKTSRFQLKKHYRGIPKLLKIDDIDEIEDAISDILEKKESKPYHREPEHYYLLGRAYLDGIHVEIDRERGIKLITGAAANGHALAMLKLYQIYAVGRGDEKNPEKALSWITRYKDYCTSVLGDKSELALGTMELVGNAYRAAGQNQQALDIYHDLYDIYKSTLGDTSPKALTTYRQIAVTYERMELFPKALEQYEKLYHICSQALGERHEKTLQALRDIAQLHGLMGEEEKMSEAFEKLYQLQRDAGGSSAVDSAFLNSFLFFYGNHMDDQACEVGERFYQNAVQALGRLNKGSVNRLFMLAVLYERKGNYPRAIEICKEVVSLSENTFGKYDIFHLVKMFRLAELYESAGEPEQAAALYREVSQRYRHTKRSLSEQGMLENRIEEKLKQFPSATSTSE